MKKIILAIVVLLAIMGIWYFSGRGVSQDANSDSDNADVMIKETSVEELPDGAFTLDSQSSELRWAAERVVGKSHRGDIKIGSGMVEIEDGALTSGSFVIDMSTITESNSDQMFLEHINSDDFFATDRFSTARLELKSVEKVGESYQVTADLTIKDITNEITFPATISESEGVLTARSEFQIDRTKWDIVFDSSSVFLTIGDKAIRDEITFNLVLVVRPS